VRRLKVLYEHKKLISLHEKQNSTTRAPMNFPTEKNTFENQNNYTNEWRYRKCSEIRLQKNTQMQSKRKAWASRNAFEKFAHQIQSTQRSWWAPDLGALREVVRQLH